MIDFFDDHFAVRVVSSKLSEREISFLKDVTSVYSDSKCFCNLYNYKAPPYVSVWLDSGVSYLYDTGNKDKYSRVGSFKEKVSIFIKLNS